MKSRLFQSFYLLISLLFFGTQLVGQSANLTVGCAPLQVEFQAPQDATTFFWDFKDGATSDLQNPTNTFIDPGVYEVDFRASQNGEVIGTITVSVYATPTPAIVQEPNPTCTGDAVILKNTTDLPEGVTATNISWVFPDGTASRGEEVQKTYEFAGSYSVNLALITDAPNCNVSAAFDNFINVVNAPQADFDLSPGVVSCTAPYTVAITNLTRGDSLTYFWDFGNGNTFDGATPEAQTYESEGDYTISLTVEGAGGCVATETQTVSVGSPNAAINLADTLCVGESVIIRNESSAGIYQWTIEGPSGTINSAAVNPVITPQAEGLYFLRLLVASEDGLCEGELLDTFYAQQLDASFTLDPTYGCSEPFAVTFTPSFPEEGVDYAWDFGDDSTSIEQNPTHEYYADNESPYHENGEFIYTASLTMTSSAGCEATTEAKDTLDIPLARFMPDTVSGCAPLTVEFSDSSRSTFPIQSWTWLYDDGSEPVTFDNNQPHDYTFTEPGEYDVQLVITNELGCPDTSYAIRIEVGAPTSPDFSVDNTSVCPGDLIQFSDISNNPNIDEWHYYTDNGRSSHCYRDANPMIPFETETGMFDVTMVVGYNGCLDSIKQTDFIETKGPLADIAFMMSCDTPNTVMFVSNSGDATNLSWDFGDGTTGTADTISHDYASTGDYEVILTAENPATGCPATSDTTLIQIRNIKAEGPVEMLQCKDQPVMLNSAASQDVDTSCFRGYTWFFNHPSVRPVTTNEMTVEDVAYPDTGMYQIDLVVEDVNGCTDTASYPVVVHEATISFELDKDLICTPALVNITNVEANTTSENIESYMWDFGDGIGMSEAADPGSYTYSIDPGGNQITVSVAIEDDAGCPGEASQTIGLYRPVSDIITDVSACAGDEVDFSATPFSLNGQNSPLDYDWTFGNGESATTPTSSTIYEDGGSYPVRLEYTEQSSGCAGVDTVIVNVQDYPVASFITDVDDFEDLCAPAQVAFSSDTETTSPVSESWDFGNGSSAAGTNVNADFIPGTYEVTLVVSTSFQCRDTASRTFVFDQGPEGQIALNGSSFCIGDVVMANLTDTSDVKGWSWEFEGQTFGENEGNISFEVTQVPQAGIAPLKLNLFGAGDCRTAVSDQIPIDVVQADFQQSGGPCELDRTFINTSTANANSFMWDFGDGTTSTETSPVHTYAAEGSYTVTLIADNLNSGCSSEFTTSVNVSRIDPFVTNFEADVDSCDLNVRMVNLTSGVADQFTWNMGDGTILNEPTPVYTYQNAGTYTITLTATDSETGCTGTSTASVRVPLFGISESDNIMPNAFTPERCGGDMGTNDIFRVKNSMDGLCSPVARVLSFQVFNRWGTEVYSAENIPVEEGWNGCKDNEIQPAGVYLYIIEVELTNQQTEVLKGNVTLIR